MIDVGREKEYMRCDKSKLKSYIKDIRKRKRKRKRWIRKKKILLKFGVEIFSYFI